MEQYNTDDVTLIPGLYDFASFSDMVIYILY